MGKRLILSSIAVHREQDPPGALFFEPDDEHALAQAMATHWSTLSDAISAQDEQRAAKELRQRTIAYAEGYSRLVQSLESQVLGSTGRAEISPALRRHRNDL